MRTLYINLFFFSMGCLFRGALALYFRLFHPQCLAAGGSLGHVPSDGLMQTLVTQQLHDAPLQSLFYLHIQPPMLDIIRAIISAFSPYDKGPQLLYFIDGWIYILWGGFYALLATLVFHWIRSATGSLLIGAAAWMCWILHPGALMMSTLSDSTMPSSFLTTWLLYALWHYSSQQNGGRNISLAAIGAFLTRTVFQWPFVFVLAAALWIAGASRKAMTRILLPVIVVVSLLVLKQYLLFNTTLTTTFSGEHKLGVIGYHPTPDETQQHWNALKYRYPDGAKQATIKYNTEWQATINIIYGDIAAEQLKCCPLESLNSIVHSISINAHQLLLPTSSYFPNIAPYLRQLPWLLAYEIMFSRPFVWAVFLAAGAWLCRNIRSLRSNYRCLAAPLLAAYVLMVLLMAANRYEWTEVNRLRFLLEPAAFVLIITQFTLLLKAIIVWFKARIIS